MQLQGKFTVKAPVQKVWGSLWDEQTLPNWLPGCTKASISGNSVKATVEQSVAFLKSKFDMDLEVVERQDPVKAVIQGAGKDPNIASQVKLTMNLNLTPVSEDTTDVSYSAEVQIYGRVATIGHFVIQAKTKDMEKELAARVKKALEG